MKYANLIMGLLIFMGVITLYLGWISSLSTDYNSIYATTYTDLAGKYDYVDNISNSQDSTLRTISNTLDDAGFSYTSLGVAAIDQGVSATKQTAASIGVMSKIGGQLESDLGLPLIFKSVIIGIITVVIVLGILFMIMRAKMET